MLKIAGVTVLYNPDRDVLLNIQSYIEQIECLYIVDNSENAVKNIIDQLRLFPKIKLLDNKGNIGLAAGLNKAADQAIEDGFDFLLTMDQDSHISKNLVKEMTKVFEKDETIGILSPFVIHMKNPRKPPNLELKNIFVAMTSGCIVRLSAYKKIGKFLEKLFLDYVDNEFCLRMKLSGYKVLRLNSVMVYHHLGTPESRKFIYKNVFPTNHSPLRWYYRTRNRNYFYKIYKNNFPDYIRFDKMRFLKDFLQILIYESEKIKKIKMIIKGYLDFKKNRFGKYNELNN